MQQCYIACYIGMDTLHYAIRGLIKSARMEIKNNNRENDIALLKWPKD